MTGKSEGDNQGGHRKCGVGSGWQGPDHCP